ncbi:helix-turn-helix domain-containing protein [Granulicella arctica]|uniref:helix-turn-helix domain-containing protein n=1 Tax=Granulicella arctica TaxID=940613 RepID=UPI0021E05499|nr:helix-turn-helix domain-containing protein [Granulicella arctica]
MHTGSFVDTQDVAEDYKAFLAHTAKRIKELRRARGLKLRDMVVVHGYHDSNLIRMEREGVGSVQGLLRIAKAFGVPITTLTAGVGDHFAEP